MTTPTGVLFNDPRDQPLSTVGLLQAGAYRLFYLTGTTTPTNVYSDGTLATPMDQTPHTGACTADSAGRFARMYMDPSVTYRCQLYSSLGVLLDDTDPYVVPSSGGGLTQAAVGQALNPRTTAEVNASITPSNYAYGTSPFYDMNRYGVQPNGVDNTAIVQAVFNMAKVTGGTMVFPPGDWSFYLDISGTTNANVTIEGQGSIFRPFTATPTNSAVIFADNSATAFSKTNVIFRRCKIIAQKYSGGAAHGDLNYAVYHKYAASTFYDCDFTTAKTAAFYCLYGQYTEFWSCSFDSCSNSSTSAGCLLDSNTVSASTNEVNFNRCKFFLNSIALWLKGCILTRLRDCTIQGQVAGAAGAIILDQDSSGSSTQDTVIDGCWFEDNLTTNHIQEVNGTKTTLVNNRTFASGGTNAITFAHCNDLTVLGHQDYDVTLTFTVNHPGGNTDATRITWHGNNTNPTLSIAHAGAAYFDMSITGTFVATLTGVSGSPPTVTVHYTINGDAVSLHIPLDTTGTSNSTVATLTGAPSLLTPQVATAVLASVEDNGSVAVGLVAIPSNSTTLSIFKDLIGTNFTGSGTKGIKSQTLPSYRLST